MKSLFCFVVAIVAVQALHCQPVISSFAPLSAAPGATITINGSGFNTTPANNIVYFGAVKATITSASATTLQAVVPYGATYAYLTATVSGLTGYSAKKFLPFTGNGSSLTSTSFIRQQENTAGNAVISEAVADFDGDGKTDIAAANYTDATITVFRNTSYTGTLYFATKANYSTSGNLGDVKAGDINGDGKPDIVTANYVSRTVSVFINNSTAAGTISFLPKQDFATGTYAVAVAIGDVDGDGKPDITELNNQDNTLSVLRNTSTGTVLSFAARVSFSTGTGSEPIKAELIDMDEDGKLDIIVANLYANSVFVFKNGSAPGIINFSSVTSFPVNGQARSVDLGDFDADGKMDIAVGGGGTTISVLTNTSAGSILSFSRQDIVVGTTPKSVSVGDVNGDGKPDIAVVGSEINLAVLQNTTVATGAVSFAPKIEYSLSGSSDAVLIADMDNDGKNDLVVGRTNKVVLLRNSLREPVITSFTPGQGSRDTVVTIRGQSFTGATDVSFGGTPAAAFTVLNDSTITATVGIGFTGSVVVTTSFGTVSSGPSYFYYFTPRPLLYSSSADTGRAGSIIMLRGRNFTSNSSGGAYVRFGGVLGRINTITDSLIRVQTVKSGTYDPITVTTYYAGTAYTAKPFAVTFPGGSGPLSSNSFETRIDSATGGLPAATALADFDGDEKLDIAVANYNTNTVSVFRNRSDSARIALSAKSTYATGSGPWSIAVADLDMDGILDIVVANSLSNTISTFRNQAFGSISFAAKTDFATPANPIAVKIADLNGDGLPEVAVLCRSGAVAIWNSFSYPGHVLFSNRTDFATDANPTGLALADVDQDGKIDLIVSDSMSGRISVYRNTSTPVSNGYSFVKTTIPSGYHSGIAVADVNVDGKPDLVASSFTTIGGLALYINQTTGSTVSFSNQTYPVATATAGVAVADITGDGKPDVAVSSRYAPFIAVLKNNSTPAVSFDTASRYNTATEPYDLVLGDLDGDSKPEIVACNYTAGTISILRNSIGEVAKTFACPNGNVTLTSNLRGTTYQWQVDTSSGYMNLVNSASTAGVNTATLQLTDVLSVWYGYRYRCVVDGNRYSDEYILKFQNRWLGTINNNWENAANWSCGTVPDANTDVIISSGSVVLGSNTSCRSVTILNSGRLTVVPGNVLTITR